MNSSFKLKCLIVFAFLTALSVTAHAQDYALKISNSKLSKELIIKHNKRVRLFTNSGLKLNGKAKIAADHLVVEGQRIELDEINKIKRNPAIISFLTTSASIYVGAVTLGVGTMVALFGGPQPLVWIATGSGLLYLGTQKPNPLRAYKESKGWQYEIIPAN